MHTDDLLVSLYTRGVRIRVGSGQLHIHAPHGALLQEELDRLREEKPQIIQRLQQTNAPLRPREPDALIPLSSMQMLGWGLLFAQGNRIYTRVCTEAVRVTEDLDVELLQRCLNETLRRHESLRTRLVAIDGLPRQEIDPYSERQFELIDLTKLPASAVADELTRLSEAFLRESYLISVGPFFDAKIFRLQHDEHVVILAIDHMVADGVSVKVLNGEIWTLYDRAKNGLPFSLPPLAVQFPDYAVWQHKTYLHWLSRHAAYWKKRMTGAPLAALPFDHDLVQGAAPVGAFLQLPLGKGLSGKLQDVARREKILPGLVILTVYLAVMSQWCKQRDLLVTFVSSGRGRPELHNMIGFLSNHIHLRLEVDPDDSFNDLLRRVTAEYYSAYEHQDYGWVPSFVPECKDSIPNINLYFNWLPAGWSHLSDSAGGAARTVQVQPHSLPMLPHRFKFRPCFSETEAGIVTIVQYRSDLFQKRTIENFVENLRRHARRFTQNPHALIGHIDDRKIRN